MRPPFLWCAATGLPDGYQCHLDFRGILEGKDCSLQRRGGGPDRDRTGDLIVANDVLPRSGRIIYQSLSVVSRRFSATILERVWNVTAERRCSPRTIAFRGSQPFQGCALPSIREGVR